LCRKESPEKLNMSLSDWMHLSKIRNAGLSDRRKHTYIPTMITRVFTGFAWAGFLFWSLLCLGLWAAIALGGDVLRWLASALLGASADGTAAGVLRFLEAFGTALVMWVWLAGSAVIAFAGFALRRMAGDAASIRVATFRTGNWEVREMKDVTPSREPGGDLPRLPGR
jgi:hypothetical protein